MRIYSDCYELMSETARNLWEMGVEVKPKRYQNKDIEGNEDFITKEITSEQYCLLSSDNIDYLFKYTKSRDWADAEFEERVDTNIVNNPGEAYLLRKDVWEQFLVDGKFDYTYAERMTYLNRVINLIKEDPDTRKAILSIYDATIDSNYYDGSKRIPCSMYYNFQRRKDRKGNDKLNLIYHQRSSDFVTHFGNDVYLALKLQEYVANKLNIEVGNFIHNIDSLHSYKKDWGILKTSLKDY